MNNQVFFDSTVEKELHESGVYISVTKGSSMRPLFKTNRDVVRLEICDNKPGKYDVVLYRNGSGKYLLHRIVRVLPEEYIIRGDNTFVREHVAKDRVIAVLTEYNRKGKKHSTEDFGFRVYSRLWNFIYPVRFIIFKALMLVYKIYTKVFRSNK